MANETFDDLLGLLFPHLSEDIIGRFSKIASCLPRGLEGEVVKNFLEYVSEAGFPITIEETLTDNALDTFEFDVVNGRSGSIATAVDGADIDAASTIEIQYSLVEAPGANDWKAYENGSFVGEEANVEIEFVGRKNRIVWTPNANEDLRVMVSL